MLSILIAVIIGAGVGFAVGHDLQSLPWGIVCGIGGYILTQVVISLILRRKINALQEEIQTGMAADRERINRQLSAFQQRQPGNLNGLKQLADRLQGEVARKLLESTKRFEVFYPWSPMLGRQINAMKVQLHYQLRDYAEVDKLLPKTILVDPLSLAIKLVRLYKREDAELDNFYKKKCAGLKADNGAFLACVYAWIKLKQQNPQAALAALRAASKLSDNQVLLDNLNKLANDRRKDFSNAGFGEQWYALALEEYKPKPIRQKGGRMY